MLKFNVGDKARIIGDTSLHGFNVGEIVEIVELCDNGTETEHYGAINSGDKWYLGDEELQAIFAPADLKSGMRVRYDNGSVHVVIGKKITNGVTWMSVANFNDSMESSGGSLKIVEVLDYPNYNIEWLDPEKYGKTLWKREVKNNNTIEFKGFTIKKNDDGSIVVDGNKIMKHELEQVYASLSYSMKHDKASAVELGCGWNASSHKVGIEIGCQSFKRAEVKGLLEELLK